MAVVRATLDNSEECWTDYIKRWFGINDFNSRKPSGYKLYTWDEIFKHDSPNDCWIVIHGKVYDVTEWVPRHPGGDLICVGAGGDCTSAWESYHPSSLIEKGIAAKFLIGEVRDYEEFYSWDGDFYKTLRKRVEAVMPKSKNRRYDPKLTTKGFLILILYFISLGFYIYFWQMYVSAYLRFYIPQDYQPIPGWWLVG